MVEDTHILERLQHENEHLKLYTITDHRFRSYGRVMQDVDVSEIIEKMQDTPIPDTGNVYVPSWPPLEAAVSAAKLATGFGGDDVQIGYCNGMNSFLRGLEYHKSSEVNVAVTDLVLLLGHHSDIRQNRYHADLVEAFYIPGGTVFEVDAGTLHYGPCKVWSTGFKCVVALPRGTNLPLSGPVSKREGAESQLMFRRNKWLLVHPSTEEQVRDGAYPGIDGPNVEVKYLHLDVNADGA